MRATIDASHASRPAVIFVEAPGRWPEHEEADRLVLCAGLAAIALDLSETGASEMATGYLRAAAEALGRDGAAGGAVGELARRLGGRRDAVPSPPVEIELRRSSLGAVPRLRGSRHGQGSLLHAMLAMIAFTAEGASDEDRLALALVLEGVLAWQRTAGAGLQSAQQAVAHAVHHAATRLEERGRRVPPALARAAGTQRRLAPMAGGA